MSATDYDPPTQTSDRGERETGIVWSIRRESEQTFHGKHATRHDAIGLAAIIERVMDEEVHVRAHESMWREREEPLVCDYCGSETWYMPIVAWVFEIGTDAGPFCTRQCQARFWHGREEERQEAIDSAE